MFQGPQGMKMLVTQRAASRGGRKSMAWRCSLWWMECKWRMGLFQYVEMISLACIGLDFYNFSITYSKVQRVSIWILFIIPCLYLTYFIFEGQQVKYSDGIFQPLAQPNNCLRSYHRATADAPLNNIQRHENRIMKKVRVLIEHTYASIDNHFKIMNNKTQWKPSNTESHLAVRMQFVFFLANCHCCVHGNSMSKTFGVMPPRLVDFLGLPPMWFYVDKIRCNK